MTTNGFVLLPALDVAAGRAVRLVRGQVASTVGDGDPVKVALGFQRDGAGWIHLVDVDAAFQRGSNAELLADVVRRLDVPVQVSGGVREQGTLEAALATGATRAVLSTAALEHPQWVRSAIDRAGDRLVVGLDVRGHRLAARGRAWPGGDVFEALAALDADGAARYVVTDVSRDGALSGPNLDLLRRVVATTGRPVIASGGVSGIEDLRMLAGVPGVEGAVVGSALATGAFTLPEALAAVGGWPG